MIYFKTKGNLGNVLFEYATALSVDSKAICYTDDPDFDRREEDFRKVMPRLRVVRELPPEVRTYVESGYAYRPLPTFGVDEKVLLDGYFQSEKYFDVARVREALTPDPVRVRAFETRFAEWLAPEDVTSIHVRRGDYLKLPHCHPFVGEDYFRKALARLSSVRHFIVFSNDIPWCRTFFGREFPDREFRFSEGLSPADDLLLQSLCRHHIISNSTFSWWGAWLGRNPSKRILAPSEWFGSLYRSLGYDWRDIYPAGAEVIENPLPWSIRLQALYTRAFAAWRWRFARTHLFSTL